jgi:hypothetical protein
MCTHRRSEVRSDSLLSLCKKLIVAAKPGIAQPELLALLQLRCPKPDPVQELLDSNPEWHEHLSKSEAAEHKLDEAQKAAARAEKESYLKEFASMRRQLRSDEAASASTAKAEPVSAKAKGKAKGRGRGRGRPADQKKPDRPATRPPPDLDENVTEERANELLPPGHKLWRDAFCCRWQWTRGRDYMSSRSWRKFGYVESLLLLLRAAWQLEVAASV